MIRKTVKANIILTFKDLDEDASEEEIGLKVLETEQQLNEIGDSQMGDIFARFHISADNP